MANYDTFQHPGFPAIGAIEKFRQNTASALEQREHEFKQDIERMRAKEHRPTHSGRDALKMRKKHDSPLVMNAYFDKRAYKSLAEDVTNEVERIGEDLMEEALFDGMADTARELRAMTNFKSKIKPNQPATGDMYEKIGDSLRFTKTRFTDANQFVSYEAGSFDVGDSRPEEGVRGSRMASDVTLITITEEGTSPFAAHLVNSVFNFPAKRHG